MEEVQNEFNVIREAYERFKVQNEVEKQQKACILQLQEQLKEENENYLNKIEEQQRQIEEVWLCLLDFNRKERGIQ